MSTLPEPNAGCQPEVVIHETLNILIGGQSNASGRGSLANVDPQHERCWMFGNDYVRKLAYEPTDDTAGQVDAVSQDPAVGCSFGLRLARRLAETDAHRGIMLIPCAKGSTSIAQWMPTLDRIDRNTLYGSANYRCKVAAPQGLTAIVWYGHESNAPDDLLRTYIADWTKLVAHIKADFGDVPFFYIQLAKVVRDNLNHAQHLIAEMQRLTESGSGDVAAIPNTYMVPAFDLPLTDIIHLNDAAQQTLGDRLALAIRQVVLGEAINGFGPRLVSVTHPNGDQSLIKVKTSKPLLPVLHNADGQFRVFDDGAEVFATSVISDPNDNTAALITLANKAAGVVTVSYGDVTPPDIAIAYVNVIKDTDGLPLPQFGTQTVK